MLPIYSKVKLFVVVLVSATELTPVIDHLVAMTRSL
jgi:hypothetical protein